MNSPASPLVSAQVSRMIGAAERLQGSDTAVGRSILSSAKTAWVAFMVCAMTASSPTFATGHEGGNEASSPEPMQFVLNSGKSADSMRYLAVKLVPDYASPEASRKFERIRPRMFHRIILSLSSLDTAVLMTSKGKRDLQESLVADLNGLLSETREAGIRDVFFTDFVVQ